MKERLIAKIKENQNNSARSNQIEIGASELGGCRRRVWLRINGQEETNPNTLVLSSFMGTAIHTAIEQLFDGDVGVQTEVEVFSRGLKGHVDLIADNTISDWKTITKKNVAYFGSQQQRWQVQTYALMANDNGHFVDTVQLVGIARDGSENDIVVLTEEYSEAVALEALAWLDDIKARTEIPAPEKDALFCADYCPFFGACPGRTKESEPLTIDDFDVNQAAKDYIALGKQIKELELQQEGARAILEGANGVTPDGIKISWSETKGREITDDEAIVKLIGYVPKKIGNTSRRLTVKQ